MEKNFDFDSIGKRMPYRMPENLLQDMEASVMEEINRDKRQKKAKEEFLQFHNLFRQLVAAAAVAILFIVCYNTIPTKPQNSYADIDRAFDNLSYDDQAFMIDTYNNDAFAYVEDSNSY